MALDQETLEQLLDGVRRYVRERLVPLEAQVAEEDAIPMAVVMEMRELGLFGLSIPEEYGGLGLTMAEEVRVVEELGWTSPAFRSVVGTNIGIGSQGILFDGTPAQKQRFLPKLASGELIASFALTEPEAGSDAASLRMTARRDGAFYVLNGTKRFITNAPSAGIFTVMARTGSREEKAAGISAFIVDADTRGILLGKPEKKMGQKGTHVCDVIFEDVYVPLENLIGGVEGMGFKTAMKVLDRGRLHISALAVGMAARLIAESVAYANERCQFGAPIASFQLIQAMIADSATEHYAGRCMTRDAASRYDGGERITTEASCCKLFCSEMLGRVADRAVQIFGGAGYMAEYPVERFYRDVRLLRIYEGTSQIQQILIARSLLSPR